MRLLADENFPKPIVEGLRADGRDVLWARTDCAGWKDVVLLDLAESEARIVLTFQGENGLLIDYVSEAFDSKGLRCQ
jgi:hypothetical protein